MTIAPDRRPQRIALACGLCGIALMIYAFNYIDRLPAGDGSNFKWLLAVPVTGIFLFLCLPALILAAFKRTSTIAIGFGVCGIIAYVVLWLADYWGL